MGLKADILAALQSNLTAQQINQISEGYVKLNGLDPTGTMTNPQRRQATIDHWLDQLRVARLKNETRKRQETAIAEITPPTDIVID